MGKQKRVHDLAKELGVASKEIIAKCHAEGVDLKNHMAVISIGLAESIREWFSVGADVTTIEVAQPVDLEKVKKPRRTKPRSAVAADLEHAQDEAPVAAPEPHVAAGERADLTEPPAATPAIAARSESGTEAEAGAPQEGIAAPMIETRVAPEPAQPATIEQPAAEAAAPAAEALTPPPPSETPPSRVVEPPKPVDVRPAGPQLVPAPAELRGPRVVRIEAPEPVRAPKPRPSPYRPSEAPAARGFAPVIGAPSSGGPPRGRKRGKEESESAVRPRSPRRGGVTEVVERLKEWRDQDVLERKERLASATGHGLRARRSAERVRQATTPAHPARKNELEIVAPISVKEFCSAVGVPFSTVSSKLIQSAGKLLRINDTLDVETVELLSLELGLTLKVVKAQTAFERLKAAFDARERNNLRPRPPVVAMLGHVDHGKTSLLDAIRRTKVAAGEAGGITQHIGAYRVDRGDWHVTFLDTPGHEAFTAMRARGANLTDVVVLVVAADDGVMPQTVEAINHARAAGVQIVVALNKCDLPNYDTNRIFAQLAEHGLTPSEWGGTTDVIRTSAVTNQGIDELLSHLSTLSELLELKADPSVPARATVVEARMREGHGVVAQVLVREGTLKPGETVVCGPAHGRVRSLIDDKGRRVNKAEPGTPVQVGGLDELPDAGDELYVVSSAAEAKAIAEEVRQERRAAALAEIRKPLTLEALLRGDESETPELSVILRADVQGSVDALRSKLAEFPSEKARLKVLHAG
ncbi:MAG: translation initiation factor IF-2, partial [Phycisphaerae bacterium]